MHAALFCEQLLKENNRRRSTCVFVFDGKNWIVRFKGETYQFDDSTGMRILAYLLTYPHVRHSAAVLAGVGQKEIFLDLVSSGFEIGDQKAVASYKLKHS